MYLLFWGSKSLRRYRLGVRIGGSQPSDRGSNPRSAANASFEEEINGSLKEGKLAGHSRAFKGCIHNT